MNEPIRGDRCFGVIHNPTPRRKQIVSNNYNNMNVHELVYAAMNEGWLRRIEPGSDREYYLPAIESALRRKVIREASVGVVKLSHNGVASDYDIVPKENP